MKNVWIFQLESHGIYRLFGQNGQLCNEFSHLGNGKYVFLFIPVFLCVHQSQSFPHMCLTFLITFIARMLQGSLLLR